MWFTHYKFFEALSFRKWNSTFCTNGIFYWETKFLFFQSNFCNNILNIYFKNLSMDQRKYCVSYWKIWKILFSREREYWLKKYQIWEQIIIWIFFFFDLIFLFSQKLQIFGEDCKHNSNFVRMFISLFTSKKVQNVQINILRKSWILDDREKLKSLQESFFLWYAAVWRLLNRWTLTMKASLVKFYQVSPYWI